MRAGNVVEEREFGDKVVGSGINMVVCGGRVGGVGPANGCEVTR